MLCSEFWALKSLLDKIIGLFNIKRIRRKIGPGIMIPAFYCLCGIILAISSEFDGKISIAQRISIITIMLFIGFLSMGVIVLVKKTNE
jgi:hypothetical protein